MAEDEVARAAAPAAADGEEPGAPACAEDEKEIPKPDMTVKRPDEAAFSEKVEAVQARMEAQHKRIQEIKETLDARESTRTASSSESGQARQRLQELRTQSRGLSTERNAIYSEINEMEDARKLRSNQIADLKKRTPYATTEEIDRAIKEKEHYQETHALSLAQVKKIMAELKELHASKPLCKELHDVTEALKRDKEASNVLYAKLKEKTAELNAVREIERKQQEEVERIRKKDGERVSDVPGLIKERDECKKAVAACREEIKKLRDEHNAAKKAYADAQRLIKRYQMQERRKEWLKREAERDARRKEREAEDALRVPWEEEMGICDILVTYLGRYVQPKPAAPENGGAAENGVSPAPAAPGAIGRKAQQAEESFFVGSGGGGKKGKKGKAKKEAGAGAIKVTHTPEVFANFDKLGLKPPLTAAECEVAISEVLAKKSWYKTAPPKAELVRQQQQEKRRAEEAAAEAAKKAEEEAKKAEEEVRAAEEEARRAAAEAAAAEKAAAAEAAAAAKAAAGAAAATAAPKAAPSGGAQSKAAKAAAPPPQAAAAASASGGAPSGGCTLSIQPISETGVLVSITTT